MEGSGPPFSQELLYAYEALQEVNRTLGRLYIVAPYRSAPGADVELLKIMRALAEQGNELRLLAGRIQALGQ